MNEKNIANDNMSLSKQRKLQRKKDIERSKRNKVTGKIAAIVILALLVAAVGFVGFILIRNAVTHVNMNSDFSKMLTDKGLIEGVKATDYVTLPDYKNIPVPYSNIELKDEDLQKQIESLLNSKAEQSETTEKAVEKGDVIYVVRKGYFEDGTEVPNSGTGDTGTQITVGSSSFKDYGYDEKLIGKKVQDEAFDIEVTFPEDYSDKNVAGKKVKYNNKIKSIKITPEFNDEFVLANYKDKAKTAEAYKQYLKDTAERNSLIQFVSKNFLEGCKINSYPNAYLKQVKSLVKYNDYQNFLYNYNMYIQYPQYFGQPPYSNFEAYIKNEYKMSEAKYDRTTVVENAKVQLAQQLFFQAVAENENILATIADYKAHLLEEGTTEENFESAVKTYGEPALVQQYLIEKVQDFLADSAKVVKD
jgi:trigger factor